MDPVSPALISAAILTLAAIVALGVSSGKHVKNASDFDTGGNRAGPVMVAEIGRAHV